MTSGSWQSEIVCQTKRTNKCCTSVFYMCLCITMCKMLLFISVVLIVVGGVSALLLKAGPFEVSLTWTRCTLLTDSLAVRQERAVFGGANMTPEWWGYMSGKTLAMSQTAHFNGCHGMWSAVCTEHLLLQCGSSISSVVPNGALLYSTWWRLRTEPLFKSLTQTDIRIDDVDMWVAWRMKHE